MVFFNIDFCKDLHKDGNFEDDDRWPLPSCCVAWLTFVWYTAREIFRNADSVVPTQLTGASFFCEAVKIIFHSVLRD